MNSKILVALGCILSFSVFSQGNDFDKFCRYFEMLDKDLAIKSMSDLQKTDFISELVTQNIENNSPARQIWEVIIYAVPDERYEIFQSTANELLKKNWKCYSMKKHILMVGE